MVSKKETATGEGMKLTFRAKFFYGFGETPNTVSKVLMGLFFMFFLTDVVGLEPALAGLIFMIGRCWDAFSDPLVGRLSDRTRTRWGRRRPFILFAAIPLGVSFFLMWYRYPVDGQIAKMILYTLAYITYMTCVTCYHVPYIGLFPELTDDYTERTSITNYRQFFSSFFGLIAAVVPKMVIDGFDDKALGFMVAIAPPSILIATIPFIVFSTTRERFHHRPIEQERESILTTLKFAFKSKAFVSLIFIFLGCWAAVNVIEGFVLYYMKYWLLKEEQMPIVFLVIVIVSICSLPLWSYLTKKIGKRNTTILGLSLWAIPQLGWLMVYPSTSFTIVCVVTALIGVGYGGAHIFSWAIFPDVMDQFELETGKRQEGIYSGVLFFIQKLSHSLSMFVIGLILQWTGYTPNVAQEGASLQAIRLIMSFGPFLFIIVGVAAAFFFPISVKRYMEIRQKLDARGKDATAE
jgi:sugar (glycoside-pentoside-hexuronide) transporter